MGIKEDRIGPRIEPRGTPTSTNCKEKEDVDQEEEPSLNYLFIFLNAIFTIIVA